MMPMWDIRIHFHVIRVFFKLDHICVATFKCYSEEGFGKTMDTAQKAYDDRYIIADWEGYE